MSTKKTMIGVLTGVAVGAIFGVLYAPSKGSVTRRKFSRQKIDFSLEMEDKLNDLIDNITEQFKTVVEEVNQIAKDGNLKTAKVESR